MPAQPSSARPELTDNEIAWARSVQIELGAGKPCLRCGQWKPVRSFRGFGAAVCRACSGERPWVA